MRQNRFIATKDHLILLAASNEIGDELWAGSLEYRERESFQVQTTNAIGFLVRGTVNTFINTSNTGESWTPYTSASQPLMIIRDNFIDFGLVSTADNTLFGSLIPKELIFSSQNGVVVGENLDQYEEHVIKSTDQTVDVRRKCKVYQKRDVNTFEGIDQEPLNINAISDSDIQVEVEE